MANSRTGAVIGCLRGLEGPMIAPGEADGELLERFVRHRDEAAIEALVQRHAPMVWGVCRRILGSHHDAEDALQATFIVLVRRAAVIVPRETVANWLYGVARQTALKARQGNAKRNQRERPIEGTSEPAVSEADPWRDLEPLLDGELSALPEKYRVLIVLCDLEGLTRREAAAQLTLPEGTVAGRLARARTMLAKRLTRQGIPVSALVLPGALANGASAGVPGGAVSSAVQTAICSARGGATGSVAQLAQGVLKAMFVTKLKIAAGVLLAFAAVGAAIEISVPLSGASDDPPKKSAGGDSKPLVPIRPPGDAETPANLSGGWEGEGWGRVELKMLKPGIYEGTYTDTFGPGPGAITLTWAAEDRRFNGTWAEGKDRFGAVSVRLTGREIRGAFATDPACKIHPGKPALSGLHWVRKSAADVPSVGLPSLKADTPAKDAPEEKVKKLKLVAVNTITSGYTTKPTPDAPRPPVIHFFWGRKNEVRIAPGQSALVEMPKRVREITWHIPGYVPEGAGNAEDGEEFDYVYCKWEKDGKVTFILYKKP